MVQWFPFKQQVPWENITWIFILNNCDTSHLEIFFWSEENLSHLENMPVTGSVVSLQQLSYFNHLFIWSAFAVAVSVTSFPLMRMIFINFTMYEEINEAGLGVHMWTWKIILKCTSDIDSVSPVRISSYQNQQRLQSLICNSKSTITKISEWVWP